MRQRNLITNLITLFAFVPHFALPVVEQRSESFCFHAAPLFTDDEDDHDNDHEQACRRDDAVDTDDGKFGFVVHFVAQVAHADLQISHGHLQYGWTKSTVWKSTGTLA